MPAFLDNNYCFLRTIFIQNLMASLSKLSGLKLSKYQFFKFLELYSKITKCLIVSLLLKLLPSLILNKTENFSQHLDLKNALKMLLLMKFNLVIVKCLLACLFACLLAQSSFRT